MNEELIVYTTSLLAVQDAIITTSKLPSEATRQKAMGRLYAAYMNVMSMAGIAMIDTQKAGGVVKEVEGWKTLAKNHDTIELIMAKQKGGMK
jgi:hypothetical protein